MVADARLIAHGRAKRLAEQGDSPNVRPQTGPRWPLPDRTTYLEIEPWLHPSTPKPSPESPCPPY